MKTTTQHSRHVSVPSDEGVRVDKSIMIGRPIQEVYSFWRRFDNLPRFMRHLESVTILDELHSHWAAKSIAGKVFAWDAEIIEQRENEMISWRSLPGSEVENAGSVWFTQTPGGTNVSVELKYVPPAGRAGAVLAKAFGADPATEIEEDLKGLKALLETGQLPDSSSAPGWEQTTKAAQKVAQAVDTCVHNNPWLAIISALLGGVTVGYLLGTRRSSRG